MQKKIKFIIMFVCIKLAYSYEGSTPNEVWDQVTSDSYDQLVTQTVTAKKLGSKIFSRAKNTIEQKDDLIPYFNKVLHSNGICLLGKWNITEANPYSGYFKRGSKAVVIARASTTLSGVKRGEKRGFGMALKIFPTDELNSKIRMKTANLFTIDTLAGNDISHFLKSKMTNLPNMGITFNAALAALVGPAFLLADINPFIRQVYEVSELGVNNPKKAITPKYFRISGSDEMILSDKVDFREELIESLRINNGIVFNIEIRSSLTDPFEKIGKAQFSEIVASESCDHRLHFHHPKFRSDLNYN